VCVNQVEVRVKLGGMLRRREEVGKRAVGGARERENEAVGRSVLRRSGRVGRLEGRRGEAGAVGVDAVAWVEVCVAAVQAVQGAVGRARVVLFSHGAHNGWDTAAALRISTCGAHSRGEAALECLLASRRRSALRLFGKRSRQPCLWESGGLTRRRRR